MKEDTKTILFIIAVIIVIHSFGFACFFLMNSADTITKNITIENKFFDADGNHVIDSHGQLYNVRNFETYYYLNENETYRVSVLIPTRWNPDYYYEDYVLIVDYIIYPEV